MADVNRRSYRSPKREAQARATENAILDAAHKLFVHKGYAATTIREVAAAANVAEPTVYTVFKDKPSLLWGVLERLLAGGDAPVPLAESEFIRNLRAESDPRERLRTAIHWGTQELFDRGIADVLGLILDAAAVEASFQGFAKRTLERRHEDSRMLVDVISGGQAHLRPDVTGEDVADLMEAIVSVPFYRILVEDRGWSREKYEQWVLRIAGWLFFGDAPTSREAHRRQSR